MANNVVVYVSQLTVHDFMYLLIYVSAITSLLVFAFIDAFTMLVSWVSDVIRAFKKKK
ncbi:TPA: hypothetical protein H2C15_004646 [Salmonella enterica]|nr:hypothetical protein [Salmonella enterica]